MLEIPFNLKLKDRFAINILFLAIGSRANIQKMKPAENYILQQPEPFRSMLMHLQILIESRIPKIELKYKWKVPYYYYNNTPFCYLNVTKGYVDVGFWASAHLSECTHFMITDGRKIVQSLRYFSLNEINEEILFLVLEEAKKVSYKGFWKR